MASKKINTKKRATKKTVRKKEVNSRDFLVEGNLIQGRELLDNSPATDLKDNMFLVLFGDGQIEDYDEDSIRCALVASNSSELECSIRQENFGEPIYLDVENGNIIQYSLMEVCQVPGEALLEHLGIDSPFIYYRKL